MKKFYSMTLASLLAWGGFAVGHAEPIQQIQPSGQEEQVKQAKKETGEEVVGTIRKAFESGDYKSFLADLDASYRKALSDSRFNEFLKMREMPPADEQLDKAAAQFETLHRDLVSQRDSQLLAACEGQGDSLTCARIKSATRQIPEDQVDALKYISSLRFKTPQAAASQEEKQLIDIDLASEYKIVQLDSQYAAKPFADRVQKHMVVKMDMLKQMQEASQSFSDPALKAKVELAAKGFDTWQERNWDMHELAKEAKTPANELDKKVGSILADYKNKKDDLYQKEFIEKANPQ